MRNLNIYKILFIIAFVSASFLPAPAVSGSNFLSVMDGGKKEIISISVIEHEIDTTLIVQSGKIMTVNNTMVLRSPPRIIYDFPYNGSSFTSIARSLKNSNIKNIRVGYHPGNIRMALDINGTNIPEFSHRENKHEITIILKAANKKCDDNKVKAACESKNNTTASKTPAPEKNNLTASAQNQSDDSPKEIIAPAVKEPESKKSEIKSQEDRAELLQKKLTEFDPNDGRKETVLFATAAKAFKEKRYEESNNILKNFIKTYPKEKYSEKAYYLLAKSSEQLYESTSSEHYSEVKNSYDDAIFKFSSSVFVPDALLSVGNLCLENNYYSEAIAYYNRVIEKNIDPSATVRALLQKGEAFCQKGKYTEAISTYEIIINDHNDKLGKTEAELGIAKALFETNSFQKSINLLASLEQDPENIYRFPDISLYLGYNYYQLENYGGAIKNLFRYYNIYPDSKINHLVLCKIGDAYRAENSPESAAKIYRLVFERFPETEGALISLTRLAEQKENGELKNGNELISLKITGKELSSSRDIYNKVISEYANKDSKNPMLEYTLLKLSMLYQKENNYSNALEILENLLKNYPQSKLRPEIIYALTDTFEAILKDGEKEQDNKTGCIDIVNIYLREKNIIQRQAPPNTLLAVAMACIRLGLDDMAADLLIKADTALPDKEKPEKLLYYLGKHMIENGQQENGLKKLDLLTVQNHSGEYAAKAYHLKGTIFLKNKKYEQAAGMFSQALKSNPETEDQIMILCDKAISLDESGLKDESIIAVDEAKNIIIGNPRQNFLVYRKIGEICLRIGKPEDALSLLKSAAAAEKDINKNIKLKFLIAQCHEALNRKSDYISVYNQIANSNDPLWSRLAKERLEAILFEEMLSKGDFNKYRR